MSLFQETPGSPPDEALEPLVGEGNGAENIKELLDSSRPEAAEQNRIDRELQEVTDKEGQRIGMGGDNFDRLRRVGKLQVGLDKEVSTPEEFIDERRESLQLYENNIKHYEEEIRTGNMDGEKELERWKANTLMAKAGLYGFGNEALEIGNPDPRTAVLAYTSAGILQSSVIRQKLLEYAQNEQDQERLSELTQTLREVLSPSEEIGT